MDDGLETNEIPTLIFGGRSKLPFAAALIIEGRKDHRFRQWLCSVAGSITYGTSRVKEAAVIAFTATGLRKLGLTDAEMASFPTAFQSGMSSPGRARALGDIGANAPEGWKWGTVGKQCDVLVVLYGETAEDVSTRVLLFVADLEEAGCRIVSKIALALMPMTSASGTENKPTFKEPFGFADGLSQPVLRGTHRAGRHSDPAQLLAPGEFILGYETNAGNRRISPRVSTARDTQEVLPLVRDGSGMDFGDFGRNGTFLVVRQLEQDTLGFDAWLAAAVEKLCEENALPVDVGPADNKEYLAAKMFGRWKNGSSLVRHPDAPGPAPDNDFQYSAQDPFGISCPLGAHIRRANPRDSLLPGVIDPLTISNSHRLLRVGRPYASQEGLDKPGIFFMCINADIELQFEVVQQTWLQRTDFHGLRDEPDPITGCVEGRHYTVPFPQGPIKLPPLANFVTVIGGAYFFMPGRAAMAFLINLA